MLDSQLLLSDKVQGSLKKPLWMEYAAHPTPEWLSYVLETEGHLWLSQMEYYNVQSCCLISLIFLVNCVIHSTQLPCFLIPMSLLAMQLTKSDCWSQRSPEQTMAIKHRPEILKVLKLVQGHQQAPGLHWKGRRSGELEATKWNNLATPAVAKRAAWSGKLLQLPIMLVLPFCELTPSGTLPWMK